MAGWCGAQGVGWTEWPQTRVVRHLKDPRGWAGRLRWYCHFMQKLEDEPATEWRNFARSADGLRPGINTLRTGSADTPQADDVQGRLF